MNSSEFISKLERLLDTAKQKDTGSWVDIPEDELKEFKEFVEDLSKYLFPPDYSGSRQVVIEIADKKRRRFPNFNFLLSNTESPEIDLQNLETSEFNLSCAHAEWEQQKKIQHLNESRK